VVTYSVAKLEFNNQQSRFCNANLRVQVQQMRRVRSDAGNQGSPAQEMPHVQEQGRAPDVARLVHPEGQRMVRDRLRQEERAERHGLGFSIDDGKALNQRHDGGVERFVLEAGRRIEAGYGIEIVVD
jgi:hypothetical protein